MYCSSVGCPGSVGCPSGEGDERVLLDFTHRSDIKRVTPTNQRDQGTPRREGRGTGRPSDLWTVRQSVGWTRTTTEREKEWDKERKGEGGNDQKWEERENWKGGGERERGTVVVVVVVKDEWEREGRPNVAPPPTMVCGVPL